MSITTTTPCARRARYVVPNGFLRTYLLTSYDVNHFTDANPHRFSIRLICLSLDVSVMMEMRLLSHLLFVFPPTHSLVVKLVTNHHTSSDVT